MWRKFFAGGFDYAEVDHLMHRIVVLESDQHVRRLGVAVDDPLLARVLVRVLNRGPCGTASSSPFGFWARSLAE
jgi:hypothetical protein